ncbi:MAG: hypothetical protein HYX26_01800 [Acidobacteriales bacterium]|nr:hypothetical protein [Terriglobales bacterium]
MDSHAYFLRVQGANETTVQALTWADLAGAGLEPADVVLLEYVEKVTRHAAKTTHDDVQLLRAANWTDEQIGEAVYITAMFAFFNRVADAFGVESMGYLKTGKLSP